MSQTWHSTNAGPYQGLVISNDDGRNVAVTYRKDDAPLVAAAPDLLAALQKLYSVVAEREQGNHDLDEELDAAEAAIAKAHG